MYTYEYPHPSVTTDIIIFSIREKQLKLLLIKRKEPPFQGSWALPGGFVNMDESIDDAAKRELAEETGVRDVYLEQLYTYGEPNRDPRERVITVAYFALIASEHLHVQASSDAAEADWFAMDTLPDLAFDHDEMIKTAHQRLVAKLDYSTIAFQLMPQQFTLSALQEVYEIILQAEIDKRNFRKWVLALENIEETGETLRTGSHRPAKLYAVKDMEKVDIIK
ncbi:MAG: NUDIX domain-containing protein [Mariprofundaceae bacterium]|nr:NUDIX domain-containing protein [Mariprofundaceae bacterium]